MTTAALFREVTYRITDLEAELSGDTAVLSFTEPSGTLTFQARVDGGSPQTISGDGDTVAVDTETAHTYQVRAVDAKGHHSPWSNSAGTAAVIPEAVYSFTFVADTLATFSGVATIAGAGADIGTIEDTSLPVGITLGYLLDNATTTTILSLLGAADDSLALELDTYDMYINDVLFLEAGTGEYGFAGGVTGFDLQDGEYGFTDDVTYVVEWREP